MYREEDYLMMSGLQHFSYCRRQWALIHIEQQWQENGRTAEGIVFHENAHNASKIEKRGDKLITRGMRIKSTSLGMSGICDVVEFVRDDNGISLFGYDGLWLPYPVEYKTGEPKESNEDILQLCAQAIALEEMLLCHIESGSLFYGKMRRRLKVSFDNALRKEVYDMSKEMHEYWRKGYTPRVKPKKGCNACSLKDICVPKLNKTSSVQEYIDGMLSGGEE